MPTESSFSNMSNNYLNFRSFSNPPSLCLFEKDNGFHTLKKYIDSALNHTGNCKMNQQKKYQHKIRIFKYYVLSVTSYEWEYWTYYCTTDNNIQITMMIARNRRAYLAPD